MNNKSLLKWSIVIGAIIIIGLSLGTIGYIYTRVVAFDKVFAQNVYIEDLSVGGLTKEEVKTKLEDMKQSELNQQSLILYKGDNKVEIAFDDLGITYNIDETLENAFKDGHEGSLFEKYSISKNGLKIAKNYTLERTFDDKCIRTFIHDSMSLFEVEPVNATIERINRQFVVTAEKNGERLDEEATYASVMHAINEPVATVHKVEAITIEVEAEYTAESFNDIQTLISSFSTSYNNASANRNENLKVAATKISRMLLPDEIFYLSNQLEPFTKEAGYKPAGTIVNGKIEDSLGGGVCQVASTLYNSVLLTDLEVITRQNHSLPVSYVPLGRDATYSTDVIDFQFRNNTGFPIFIEGYCENNKVYVNIYGHKQAKSKYDIKFESVVTEVIPAPATKYIDDPTLEPGKEVVETKALDGKRLKLYKYYYNNGILEKKELVNNSYYKPRGAVIRRGKKDDVVAGNITPTPTEVSPIPSPTPDTPPSPQVQTPTPTPIPTPDEDQLVGDESAYITDNDDMENDFFVPQE